MTIKVSSTAFTNNSAIPAKYTCKGDDVQPALQWSGVPSNAKSLAIVMDDPDAPRGTFSHWVIFDMSPDVTGIPEGGALPAGATAGKNGFGKTGYGGPCPPPGKPHHYHFKVFAADQALGLKSGSSREDVLDALKGHVLDQGELVGTFAR